MELYRTVAVVAVCITVGVASLFAMFASNWTTSTAAEQTAAVECIKAGGEWVPYRTEFRVCRPRR